MLSDLSNKFGFTEMYEWETPPERAINGRFVEFSSSTPAKIVLAKNDTSNIIGVTTVCTVCTSDNPDHWQGKNIANEFGDVYVKKKTVVEGHKQYDDKEEMNYIHTSTRMKYVPIIHPMFDEDKKYIMRSNRVEWANICLLGKCIVQDDGTCEPGQYCMLNTNAEIEGTATVADETAKQRWYVISRISDKTIMILMK